MNPTTTLLSIAFCFIAHKKVKKLRLLQACINLCLHQKIVETCNCYAAKSTDYIPSRRYMEEYRACMLSDIYCEQEVKNNFTNKDCQCEPACEYVFHHSIAHAKNPVYIDKMVMGPNLKHLVTSRLIPEQQNTTLSHPPMNGQT